MTTACLLALALAGPAQTPTLDEELKEHLASLTRQVEDDARPLVKRVGVLLDLAATLDRAAGAERDQARAIAIWQDAIRRMDEFAAKHGRGDRDPTLPLRLQAAVYVWVQGRTWFDRIGDDPNDPAPAEKARAYFEDARERLEKVVADAKELPLVSDNGRYRLSQVLADLASLSKGDRERQKELEGRAVALLETPFEEPDLAGHASLLQAELLRHVGRVDEAAKVVEAMERRSPLPPEGARVPVVVAVLIARTQFPDALARIDGSMLSDAEKAALRVKVRLAQRARLNPGPERSRLEDEVVKDAEPLRGREDRSSRRTIEDLATAIDVPGMESSPRSFELVAEGHLAARRPERAAELLARGADRAKTLGDHAKAAELRLKAGAALYRVDKFAEAEPHFLAVVDDPKAGALRPKASLLVTLGRERGAAATPPVSTRKAYVESLERHLKSFPDDPTSGDVRWLLGREYRKTGRAGEAEKLWAAIPPADPRWFEVRSTLADDLERKLVDALPSADPAATRPAAAALESHLKESVDRAPTSELRAEFALRLAALALIPGVGDPEEARRVLEEAEKRPATGAQRSRAGLLTIVALVETGRVAEAETLARRDARSVRFEEMIPAIRLLDQAATEAESDLTRMRCAAIMKILLAPAAAKSGEIPERRRAEFRLRQARSFALAGEVAPARSVVANTPPNSTGFGDAMLRDLADLYMRIEGYSLAVDVQRLRSQGLRAGSPAWFEARYGLAMAYYRSKKLDDARKIVDATAILHPSLGGGTVKERFERLRSRLGGE